VPGRVVPGGGGAPAGGGGGAKLFDGGGTFGGGGTESGGVAFMGFPLVLTLAIVPFLDSPQYTAKRRQSSLTVRRRLSSFSNKLDPHP
jgi:hypothetical protein